MTTRADGSAPMMSARAASPSFSGIVMSSVMRSGLSSWKRATASAPLPASPTTSWPAAERASLTILRMNAASSTTRMRAMAFPFFLDEGELADEPLELVGGARQLLGRRGDLLGGGAGLLRGRRDLLRGRRRLLGDRGDLGHVALHLLRARRDLVDRGGDPVDALAHVLDGHAEGQEGLAGLLDRRDAVLGAAGAVLDDL